MDALFESLLSSRPDPLRVLATTAYVVEHAALVHIDLAAIERTADELVKNEIQPPAWNYDYHYFDGTPRTVNYLFLLDALNFSFWGEPRWQVIYRGKELDGYWALAASLKQAIESDPHTADADFLAHITPAALEAILRGKGKIPMFPDRWRNARELGTVLRNLWEGEAARLVELADHDAARLAGLVAENFSSFNDVAIYQGQEVRFFKRAQIVVTDLWGAFQGQDWGEFENINVLTAFADYKLPQILRAWKILDYAPSLAEKVDRKVPLEKDSPEEVEIRAATLWAVEFLRQAFESRGRALWSIQVDWILWDASQKEFSGAKPYHRVRTFYY
jgi:hypothetical protein